MRVWLAGLVTICSLAPNRILCNGKQMWQACKCAGWLLYGAVSVGFIGVRVMKEFVLDLSWPELGTERRFWQAVLYFVCVCVCVCVCVLVHAQSEVYSIAVSIEPPEPAKALMTHSHMDRVNHSKMVGLHRVSLSLSLSFCLCLSLSFSHLLALSAQGPSHWERGQGGCTVTSTIPVPSG